MHRTLFFLFLFGFIGLLKAQTSSENLFYFVDTPESFNSFKENAKQISIVCPQTFLVSSEGVLSGSINQKVLEIAKTNDIDVMPLLVNKKFNRKILHDLLSNPNARQRSINMMIEIAKKLNLEGWQFDLEALHISDRDSFTVYFEETARALHKYGLKLSAAVVHNFENIGGPNEYTRFLYEYWRAGYDFKKLAEAADFLSIMTYSEHTRRTTPGPVASKRWFEKVIKYLIDEGIDPNKISIGIPSYSTHWFSDYTEEKGGFSNAKSISYEKVKYLIEKYDLKLSWNEDAGCHYSIWDNGGVYEYLFIEDSRSLVEKLNIFTKYKLRGISVWVLGHEDPDFWNILQQKVMKR